MTVVKCPNCGNSVTWSDKQRWRPFCSERCRLIDLGQWANESHRIPDSACETTSPADDPEIYS